LTNAYGYDPAGRRSTVTDSLGATRRMLLDAGGVVGEYSTGGALRGLALRFAGR